MRGCGIGIKGDCEAGGWWTLWLTVYVGDWRKSLGVSARWRMGDADIGGGGGENTGSGSKGIGDDCGLSCWFFGESNAS